MKTAAIEGPQRRPLLVGQQELEGHQAKRRCPLNCVEQAEGLGDAQGAVVADLRVIVMKMPGRSGAGDKQEQRAGQRGESPDGCKGHREGPIRRDVKVINAKLSPEPPPNGIGPKTGHITEETFAILVVTRKRLLITEN